jgi:hypothetical protein
MLSEMDNLLLDLALLTIGTHSLVVGTVPLTVPLYVDRSNVRSVSSVVFIIDTTYSTLTCQGQPIGGRGVSRDTYKGVEI